MIILKFKRALMVFLSIALFQGCSENNIQTINLNDDCRMGIKSESEWEYQQALYYRILKKNIPTENWTYFGVAGYGGGLIKFDSGRGIVAFSQEKSPKRIVILINSNTGKSWPCALSDESRIDTRKRGEEMLGILNSNFEFELD